MDLYYYTMRSKAAIDWAIWRSLKSKKSFQTKHFDMTGEEFYEFMYQQGRQIEMADHDLEQLTLFTYVPERSSVYLFPLGAEGLIGGRALGRLGPDLLLVFNGETAYMWQPAFEPHKQLTY